MDILRCCLGFYFNDSGKPKRASIYLFGVVSEIRTRDHLNAIVKFSLFWWHVEFSAQLFHKDFILCAPWTVIWSYQLLKQRIDLCDSLNGRLTRGENWLLYRDVRVSYVHSLRGSSHCCMLQFSLPVVHWLDIAISAIWRADVNGTRVAFMHKL